MEFGDVIASRRMVRRYTAEPVDRPQLERITAAGVSAPSAGNTRGQRLVVVLDPDLRAAIAAAAGEPDYIERGFAPWVSSAPALIVVGADEAAYRARYAEPDKATSQVTDDGVWTVPWWWVDAGASLMAMLLAAEDEGLAAGFLGAHACPDVAAIVDVPAGVRFVGLMTVGHPDTDRRSESLDRAPPDQIRWLDGVS